MPNSPVGTRLLSLREATQLLPGRPHISTLHRWRLRGVRGIRLETVRVGGRRFVSTDALAKFIDETTKATASHDPVASPTTSCSTSAAERFLDAEL
jgi:hypothetical protein